MVLLDDSLLGLGSFPVIVPHLTDKVLEKDLSQVLKLSLKKEFSEGALVDSGVSVTEVSEADVEDYFPANGT